MVHVCLDGRIGGALPLADRNLSRRRMAAALARAERHRHHLQSTVDEGAVNEWRLERKFFVEIFQQTRNVNTLAMRSTRRVRVTA